MAKDKKTEFAQTFKDATSKTDFNGGSPKSKPESDQGEKVASPGPKDSADVKSDRQAEAAKLVQNLRKQEAPKVEEIGSPTLDADALFDEPQKPKVINTNPTPPAVEGEWVILPNYMSFAYGSTRYTFERGRPTLVPTEVYKMMKADGTIK